MADSHLQLNHDGSMSDRKTVLWPNSKELQKEILRLLFERNNWVVSSIDNISGSHWKVEVSCNKEILKINLYISSIRDESRQPDEFKMQLGNTYPSKEEMGWVTLVLGIYVIAEDGKENDYILAGYDIARYDFSTNPSIRGTRTRGLQYAKIYGLYETDKSILFRPEFLYYYINIRKNSSTISIAKNLETIKIENTSSSPFRPYLAAIRTKPFLLLAGISGTGKSRIVRELARACWPQDSEEYKAHKPKNFEMIQVKPNWHDSSELIGYVSRVNGEKFVVGPFLKFIVKAMQEPDVPYFLCLDEMNLAPVEQYFAEYLSVIESRKLQEDGTTILTDPIVDYEPTDAYKSLIDQLFPGEDEKRGLFLTEDKKKGLRLTIPQNLIVVGTVNMDETTFSFSRKVLDRAMTIEMNEVDLYGGLEEQHENIGLIKKEMLLADSVEGKDVYEANKDVCHQVLNYLGEVNNHLSGTPFKIAYRTRNEFLLYVVNNLPYTEEGKENLTIARALDEVTSMKILSRIEGDDSKVSKPFLSTLMSIIRTQLTAICEDYDTTKSISLSKLSEMEHRLESGYTSFWS